MQKQIQPGNNECRIEAVTLDKAPFGQGEYWLTLHMETRKPTPDFVGFMRDKNDPSKGHHEGQVGRVRWSRYTFKNGTLPNGKAINMEEDLLRALTTLCEALDIKSWPDTNKASCPTVVHLIEEFNKQKPFLNKWLHYCIAAQVYQNKNGYNAYDLFIAPYQKGGGRTLSRSAEGLMLYDPSIHLIRRGGAAAAKPENSAPKPWPQMEAPKQGAMVPNQDFLSTKADPLPFDLDGDSTDSFSLADDDDLPF